MTIISKYSGKMNSQWSPKYNKLGPPKHLQPRAYHPTLQFLETEANKLCTQDYQQDIANYLSLVELNSTINCSMIDLQPEIQWYMRPYLLDFLVEIHQSFRLHPQTLFLAINIIDKYCSKRVVFKRHYQLVGCTALWLAAKYEDKKSRVPTLKELTIMCRDAYEAEMFVQMERHILSTLDWYLAHCSLEDSLQICLKGSRKSMQESTPVRFGSKQYHGEELLQKIENLSRFFCELSLYERNFIQFPESLIAITAHLLASQIFGSGSGLVSYERAVKTYLQQKNMLDDEDDDETFDEDMENSYPDIIQPFLSGYSEQTEDQIYQITILLINQFQVCSQALMNKYRKFQGLDYINHVQNFVSFNSNMIKQFPETDQFNDVKDLAISLDLRYNVGVILGFRTEFQQPQSYNAQLQTPKSATSTISSIFSSDFNYSNPNLTPTTSSPIYQSQQRNVFNSSMTNQINNSTNQEFIYKNHDIQNNYKIHNQNSSDNDNCPSSSPLTQRSQNKLNMLI